MSLSSVLTKIDSLSVDNQIKELTGLASGLLEMQHRRYPHLVPMYRTVHRKVPRPMVFRAIRWVNPKRMFPGAGLTKEEMQKMSAEELQELAVKLNTYREEAHVIHNRYNQMIWLIERGQSPYFIPYANIKEPRWLLLEGYMGRAERLKDGTMDWEHVLDQQAQDLRSVLLQEDKGKVKFDDIEGLWKDPNGNPRAPMFMDVKQKKGVPLRKQRTVNGQRLKVEPQAFARLFIGVAPDEVRIGEEVRMPHAGNYVNPDWIGNREKRILARDMGEAAMHLARIPKAPIRIAQVKRQKFAEQGQLLTIPAGRQKNPVFIVFDNVPSGDVANRRWQRVTQPERGGRHDPDAPFSGPEGVHRDRPPERRPRPVAPPPQPGPARRQRRGGAARAERARQQAARPMEGPETAERRRVEREERHAQQQEEARRIKALRDAERAKRDADLIAADYQPRPEIKNRLNQMQAERNAFIKALGTEEYKFDAPSQDPTTRQINFLGWTQKGKVPGGPKPNAGHEREGIRDNWNLTVLIDGKPYIHKITEDTRGELFAYMVDRGLGLHTMPAIHLAWFGGKNVKEAYKAQWNQDMPEDLFENLVEEAGHGAGYLMEFCDNCVKISSQEGKDIIQNLMGTKEGRAQFMAQSMVDFVTGNPDRHGNNWLIHRDGKIVSIDNALGNFSRDPNKVGNINIGHGGQFRGRPPGAAQVQQSANGTVLDNKVIEQEAGEYFDAHFNLDRIKEAAKIANAQISSPDIGELRRKFINAQVNNLR